MKKKNEIQGIIFDVGGVLVARAKMSFFREIKRKFRIPIRALRREIAPLYVGRETTANWIRRMARRFGLTTAQEYDFRRLWAAFYLRHAKVKRDTFAIVRMLEGNYKLAVLSNTIDLHAKINKKRKLFAPFQVVLLSNDVGMEKPDPRLFRFAAKNMKIHPKNLLFIDDKLQFVGAARKCGLRAIHFRSATQLKKALSRFGVL